jgi:hypothetical protein
MESLLRFVHAAIGCLILHSNIDISLNLAPVQTRYVIQSLYLSEPARVKNISEQFQGIMYYKPIDLERGLFAKWKISEDSSARIAVGYVKSHLSHNM